MNIVTLPNAFDPKPHRNRIADILKIRSEVAGVVLYDNSFVPLVVGTLHQVQQPKNIEQDPNVKVLFHTHPLHSPDAYSLHTEADVISDIVALLNCERAVLNTCVISTFGIVTLEISCADFTPFHTCDQHEVMAEIDNFAFNKFPLSWINLLMEDPRFMNEENTLGQRQFAAFEQCNDAINQHINREAQKLPFMKHFTFRWYILN